VSARRFFRVRELGGRWWLVDPAGRPFFAVGTNRVTFHATRDKDGRAWYQEAILARYGSEAGWARATVRRLKAWGFNCSSLDTRRILGRVGLPYYAWCPASHPFARKRKLLTAPGVPGYMTMVDIFDPAFATCYEETCRRIARPKRRDPALIGWYTDNELFWGTAFGPGRSLLDATLWQDPATFNKRELVRWLRDRYRGDLRALNRAWNLRVGSWAGLLRVREIRSDPFAHPGLLADKRAWLFHYARRYCRTVNRILKRHDPNHLNLGNRFHGWVEPELARAMGESVDVISYNKYDGQAPRFQMEEILWREGRRPVLVSEWGFRAMDAGLPNTGGVGRIVKTQSERGERYAGFLEGLARSPVCVGSVFYAWVDDPPTGGGGMMANENSNYGLVTVRDEPYRRFVGKVAAANRRAARWHAGEAPRSRTVMIATPKDYHREPEAEFTVLTDGRVVNNEFLRAFLRGPDAGAEAQRPVFRLAFDRPVSFEILVYETNGKPNLEMLLDGRTARRVRFASGPRRGRFALRMHDGWHSYWHQRVGVRVPAGPHVLAVRNSGTGWIWLDGYRLGF